MRCKAAPLLIAVGCTVVFASSAAAAAPIRPGLLVLGRRELPGFSGAKVSRNWTTSPSVYVNEDTLDTPPQAGAQLAALIRMGFTEAVQATFTARHREGVSEAIVFGSLSGAQAGLQAAVAEARATYEQAGLEQSAVPGIPGAVELGDFQEGQPGATSTVFFASGRCLLSVGDRVVNASTRAQGERAPLAGAFVLSERVQGLCA